MSGNSFGRLFRITTFGESHGKALGVVIDGCPAGLSLDLDAIQKQLSRRRPGQSSITTQRKEDDQFEVLSGLFEGVTTGTPLTAVIFNKDQRSKDYDHIKNSYRPSHADFTYQEKYGLRDYRGGGRASARETAARVLAGAVAQQLLKTAGIEIFSYVQSVGEIQSPLKVDEVSSSEIDKTIVRCPHEPTAQKMIQKIESIKKEGDSIGGTITCVTKGLPTGLGEPVFDRLEADLAKAMLSLPATKGFEIGSGFAGTKLKGSEHNDEFFKGQDSKIQTRTNFSGGVQGGISNGMTLYFNVAFKPVATILKSQKSVDAQGNPQEVIGKGRHDPCVLPRAVPMVEAMTALVLADHWLRNRSSRLSTNA